MVDSDRLVGIVGELQNSIPADIQEASEVLKQKDSIINQAHLEARRIKETAQEELKTKVSQAEIVKTAEGKADGIVQDSERKADRIITTAESEGAIRRDGADKYARETLFDLEERLANLLGQVRKGIDVLGMEVETAGSTSQTTAPH